MSTADTVVQIGTALVPLIIEFFKSRGVDTKDITADQIQREVIEPHADAIIKDIDGWKTSHPITPENP